MEMLTKAKEHLKAAKVLLDSKLLRGCVSQSYYAAFSAMCAYVRKPTSKRWSHVGLRKNFTEKLYKKSFPSEECSRFHQDLISLYTARLTADYERTSLQFGEANSAFKTAEEILDLVERGLEDESISL